MGNHNLPRYYNGQADLLTIHLPRNFSAEQRLALVQETADSLPQANRLWIVCQVGCQEQTEFSLITEAVVGPQPQPHAYAVFGSLDGKLRRTGNLELYLLTANEGST